MMHITHQQEEFSRAFIYAISAAAGLKFSQAATPDDDSVDVTISTRGLRGTTRSPRLDIQTKCQMGAATGDPISYSLKQKNYDDLRHGDYVTPRILVVVFVPERLADWTAHTEQELTMRYCAYWVSLRGLPPSTNQYSTTVHLPRTNQFNLHGLEMLMDRIGRGDTL
jgi:hypothetical protein